jgi:hypothetical protein
MDVSATGPAVAATVPTQHAEAAPVTSAPLPESGPVVATETFSESGTPALSAVPPTETSPAPLPGGDSNGGQSRTLAPAIAKLFGPAQPPVPIRLDVSYRVLQDPDVIVTVFSNPTTGEEVAQFPPEILIHLSQFFDQPRGVTLDQSA